MADDNQREELNQSLACISDIHSQCEGKIAPVGVTLPNTNNNQKKRT